MSILGSTVRRHIPRNGEHQTIRPKDVEELKEDMIEEIGEEIGAILGAFDLINWNIRQQENGEYEIVGQITLSTVEDGRLGSGPGDEHINAVSD